MGRPYDKEVVKEEIKTVQYRGRSFTVAAKYREGADLWLVFLTGLGCPKESFDDAFGAEPLADYSLLAIDFVGFGDSDKPDDFTYTMEDQAETVRLVIEQFNPGKVVLVGHSMGGAIGLLLAERLDSLAGFINLEGNLLPEDAGIASRRIAAQPEADFIKSGFSAFLRGLQESEDAALRKWATWFEKSSKVAVHRSCTSLVEWSDSGKLLAIFKKLPQKAYIYGDRTDSSHVLPKLQDVGIVAIANSGHFMMVDNPGDTYHAIGDCLVRWCAQ